MYSKQSYQGTQCTRSVGLICCLGRFRNMPAQQAGGRFGNPKYKETRGLSEQLKVLFLLLPTSPDGVACLSMHQVTNIPNRCLQSSPGMGHEKK